VERHNLVVAGGKGAMIDRSFSQRRRNGIELSVWTRAMCVRSGGLVVVGVFVVE
jgi:hypothetical protein